jgi:hypothetical protein
MTQTNNENKQILDTCLKGAQELLLKHFGEIRRVCDASGGELSVRVVWTLDTTEEVPCVKTKIAYAQKYVAEITHDIDPDQTEFPFVERMEEVEA